MKRTNLNGIEAIGRQRLKQITVKGYTPQWDIANNTGGQLALAAQVLSLPDEKLGMNGMNKIPPFGWNEDVWAYMLGKPYLERLAIAGALLAAEYDRIQATIDPKEYEKHMMEHIEKFVQDKNIRASTIVLKDGDEISLEHLILDFVAK